MRNRNYVFIAALLLIAGGFLFYACAPSKPEPVKTVAIADGDFDPANWGKAYPLEYESWLKTKDPKPAGKSKYKKGYDTDGIIYDKLSEFPYMPLLFNGWGFGVEYNEPRGHYYMLIDQLEVDPSRLKAGGACLTCKTPYAPKLQETMGVDYFKQPYLEVHSKIPPQFQKLGVTCVDCHDNKTLNPKLSRWTLKKALADIGKDANQLGRQEMRSLVCAQCHVTYIVQKDGEMKSKAVFFPWQGSKPGDVSVENIIKVIKSDPSHLEWKQNVTGFKVGFIRHPEYEFYSRNSVHWKANVACADCHMPYTKVGANKISDHNVMSPLKNDMKACQQCHTETPQWLADQVTAIQDRTVSLMNRAGYAAAVTAKLFEIAHKAQEGGKTIDKALYDQAKDLYLESFYRVIYIGAENSVGFHNPSEAGRICGDAIALAMRAEALLRQALAQAGVAVPADINLEIKKYVNDRGVKKLKFKPEFEFKDPFGIQEMLTSAKSMGK
ncbi:MAG TPA: ammonia-forming cytochrome c nitrite reductase subunit c552 [Thermodesulfobacteriota bacterium]|nr:ammonia-forming cytochrome c nitrite reductase subunit c552 [Thermodesulfobacteriota bacterium]